MKWEKLFSDNINKLIFDFTAIFEKKIVLIAAWHAQVLYHYPYWENMLLQLKFLNLWLKCIFVYFFIMLSLHHSSKDFFGVQTC